MNGLAAALLATSTISMLLLPRRWALGALLVGTCYVTRAQGVELGPFTFTVFRILIAVGLLRVLVRGEASNLRLGLLDWLMVAWGIWMLLSVGFHDAPRTQVVTRLGFVFDAWGTFFLTRWLCPTWRDASLLCRVLCIALGPIAASMVVEKATGQNFFAFLGGVPEFSEVREGRVRARGPFAHAILAGTIGAVCLPLAMSVWQGHRTTAALGVAASMTIVFASGSSGPLLSALAAAGALMLWPWRDWMRAVRWGALFGYVGLNVVMNDPAYYIVARIDLTGGSTGWYRARLIESSFERLSEWWLVGTDYTRHWMPSGVSWNLDHTDITNHYIYMGVLGGLPLMILFIAVVWRGFVLVGRSLTDASEERRFAFWALGSSWFAHAVSCFGVSYFDQSVVFLYLSLGLIGSSHSVAITSDAKRPATANCPSPLPPLEPSSIAGGALSINWGLERNRRKPWARRGSVPGESLHTRFGR